MIDAIEARKLMPSAQQAKKRFRKETKRNFGYD